MRWSRCEQCRACSTKIMCSNPVRDEPRSLKFKGKAGARMTGKRHIVMP